MILAIVLGIAVSGVLGIIKETKEKAYQAQLQMIESAARNYVLGERSSLLWFDDKTTITLAMMQEKGYLDKKIVDPRTKKEMTCANVIVDREVLNKLVYTMDVKCEEPPDPAVDLPSGMIPIVYKGNKWVKADVNNEKKSWFNYNKQQWANAATLSSDVRPSLLKATAGTEVPMNKINAMFVWIPRFKYRLFNVDGSIPPEGNPNLIGNHLIDVQFEGKDTPKSTGTQNGKYLTHPAFTFDKTEIDGFWVGKFLAGTTDGSLYGTDSTKLVVKPNELVWTHMYNDPSSYQLMFHMGEAGNKFGLTNQENAHLIKNMEWGAITYLTHSKYGKQGNPAYTDTEKPVRINNNKTQTGCGATTQNGTQTTTCNSYETNHGQAASTTGNITGIYDMVSLGEEVVAGIYTTYINCTTFRRTELETKAAAYINFYDPINYSDFSKGYLGDATIEVGPFMYQGGWYQDSWYHTANQMVNRDSSFFIRGQTSIFNFTSVVNYNNQGALRPIVVAVPTVSYPTLTTDRNSCSGG